MTPETIPSLTLEYDVNAQMPFEDFMNAMNAAVYQAKNNYVGVKIEFMPSASQSGIDDIDSVEIYFTGWRRHAIVDENEIGRCGVCEFTPGDRIHCDVHDDLL